jgi:succinoglycan biosynthesis protein ExoV
MEYIYYKDPRGNFGDDLNGWLWSKLFGEEDLNNKDAFLGIGSILFNNNKIITDLKDRKKIVFGTGIRPTYESFKYDNTWDIKFLRGPLSSYSFNNKYNYITDAAYAIRFIKDFESLKNTEKKYEVSVMPYFKSVDFCDWKLICDKLGYNYISPLSENGVKFTLKEIASSKYLITEAMHGAILADILRVPWNRYVLTTPVTEGTMVSEFKWMDWLYSVGLNNVNTTFIKFNRTTFLNSWFKKISGNFLDVDIFVKKVIIDDILLKLASVNQYYLSKDSIIQDIDTKMNDEIIEFKSELKKA